MNFHTAFINKALKVCIMFCPILLWNIFFIFQLFITFPSIVFNAISTIIVVMLCFMILFGNSFIRIEYLIDKEVIFISFRKPGRFLILKNFCFAFPILICLIFLYSVPLYFYGVIQLIFMKIDKEHFTLSEKVFEMLKKRLLLNKMHKKETIVA